MSEHIYEDSDMEHEYYHIIPFGSMREEIVRCRDCTFFSEDELGAFCTWFDFEDVDEERQREGFCSWGDKRNE